MGLLSATNSTSNFHRKITSGVGKSLLSAVAYAGLIAGANAADLDQIFTKGTPPVLPDLTWKGITIIGAIDIAGQYESHGTPYAGMITGPASFAYPTNRGPLWLLAPNQTTQSFIGVKVDTKITNDLSFIARLESGFNPTTGDLSDGLKSLQRSNGIPLASQNMSGDNNRAGQILNGEAYGGFALTNWGQLRVGRNNAVSAETFFAYDPLFSLGFSPIGLVGCTVACQGSPETARVDSSIKYLNQVGVFRTNLIYAEPGTNVKQFYQGSVGIVRPEFSIDAFAGKSKDSVGASALSGTANLGSQFLGARIYDTTSWGIFAKYAFDVGGKGYGTPYGKFIVSGGWARTDFSNPTDGGFLPGHTTIGGYVLGPSLSTNGSPGGGIVNYAYTGGDRVFDAFFIAGKYQHDEHWSGAVAYYVFHQNSYGFGVNSVPGVVAPAYSNNACSNSSFINCSGVEHAVSMRVDYDWTKNMRLYAGITYSKPTVGAS